MPLVQLECPVEGCPWKSQELDVGLATALTAALQMHDRAVHTTQAQPAPPAQPKLKLDPPSVAPGCDPDQWSAFCRQWDMYKAGMAITNNMLCTALFYCCEPDLRTDIMRDIRGNVAAMAEEDLLSAIKRLAVKDESVLVHRIKLGKMTQSPGTGIRTFLAGLRGQAALCQYVATCKETGCTHVFDFSEVIIQDSLVRGLADPEIQSDLVGDAKTDRTLDETVAFIAQKEQGKMTRSAVGDYAGAMCNTTSPRAPAPFASKCWACGGPSHGPKNDRKARSRSCEAWTFTCAKCSVKGHYSNSCSKCSNCGTWGHRDKSSRNCPQGMARKNAPKDRNQPGTTQASYVFDQLCTILEHVSPANIASCHGATTRKEERPRKAVCLEHYIFDRQWLARPSKPHPMLSAAMTPLP